MLCIREAAGRWVVVQEGVVKGCVATREDAVLLAQILEAMAESRSQKPAASS